MSKNVVSSLRICILSYSLRDAKKPNRQLEVFTFMSLLNLEILVQAYASDDGYKGPIDSYFWKYLRLGNSCTISLSCYQ